MRTHCGAPGVRAEHRIADGTLWPSAIRYPCGRRVMAASRDGARLVRLVGAVWSGLGLKLGAAGRAREGKTLSLQARCREGKTLSLQGPGPRVTGERLLESSVSVACFKAA